MISCICCTSRYTGTYSCFVINCKFIPGSRVTRDFNTTIEASPKCKANRNDDGKLERMPMFEVKSNT